MAAGLAAGLGLAAGPATAEYPEKPIRYIITFGPGGESDITARLQQPFFKQKFGQDFVVEYKPGGGGAVGWASLNSLPGDGYTIVGVNLPHVVLQPQQKDVGYKTEDLTIVYWFHYTPDAIVVTKDSEFKTIKDLVAYAKANPGKVNYASAGTGSQQHVAGELFKMMAGVDMVHVPYRGGGPALADLMGGQVQLFFGTTASTIQLIRGGKVRALAVTTATRSPALPDVPTVAEFVPGYEASSWYGIGAPKGTPAEIVDRLNKEINAGLADPKIKARLDDMGGTALTGPAAAFGKLIVDETEKWAKVVKASGAKAK
jgi:tripartite-type tricarboxylate transporter receptor subunit TctC